ncbi:MAG: MerR family transcriptional regulator [Parachlamydiaceae bacterium]|nr:MerR family transcriptional regulator [Parachlamydiaceae bacterium]
MVYTVTKLAKISGVSVRTLHWYDEIGLLKPAYYASNGYRHYEEEHLLILQQILFFRELGFELKLIQQLLGRGDFDKIVALSSHRQVLMKNLERTRKLIKTIDNTLEHLKGTKKMKESEIFSGFSKEKQAEFEKQLIDRFGEKVKASIAESHKNVKDWTKSDWEKSNKEFDQICQDMTKMIEKKIKASSQEVQRIIRRHYLWLKKYWTPTKESYSGHGQFIVESELKKVYESYHPQLPEFMAEAIQIFAEQELK